MKVKDLAKLINDHGTRPRVKVLLSHNDYNHLVYEGSLINLNSEICDLTVRSLTILGEGLLEIYAKDGKDR